MIKEEFNQIPAVFEIRKKCDKRTIIAYTCSENFAKNACEKEDSLEYVIAFMAYPEDVEAVQEQMRETFQGLFNELQG